MNYWPVQTTIFSQGYLPLVSLELVMPVARRCINLVVLVLAFVWATARLCGGAIQNCHHRAGRLHVDAGTPRRCQ